jgi:hypothetical protein
MIAKLLCRIFGHEWTWGNSITIQLNPWRWVGRSIVCGYCEQYWRHLPKKKRLPAHDIIKLIFMLILVLISCLAIWGKHE